MNTALSAVIAGFVLAVFGVPSAAAQDLKAVLLKPANGWVAEWSNPNSGNRGLTEAVFEDRGGKVVAKLHVTDMGGSRADHRCERDVAIAADAVSFDGCHDRNIVLFRDSSDRAYPLKTRNNSSNGYEWKLKEK